MPRADDAAGPAEEHEASIMVRATWSPCLVANAVAELRGPLLRMIDYPAAFAAAHAAALHLVAIARQHRPPPSAAGEAA